MAKVVPWWAFGSVIFGATGLWDLLLRIVVENSKGLPLISRNLGQGADGSVFPRMQPYFDKQSVGAAMFFAGISGLTAILLVMTVSEIVQGRWGFSPSNTWTYLGWIALISAIVGLGMKYSNYAPPLASTYYALPVYVTFLLDALSGVMVAAPVLLVIEPPDPPFSANRHAFTG